MITDLVKKVTFGKMDVNSFNDFTSGDTIEVSVRIKEGSKERIQIFKGVVLKVQGKAMGRSFTVRKISGGVGVERTFPFASPSVQDIKVISRGKVRRSRIYFLRGRRGRAARLETTLVQNKSTSKKKNIEAKAESKESN